MSVTKSLIYSFLINLNSFFKQLIVFLLDILISISSIILAYLIINHSNFENILWDDLYNIFLISITYIPVFVFFGLYKSIFRYFNNKAIFIYCLKNNKLIGGALFDISKDEAFYSVGVYSNEYKHEPISHFIQMMAINEFNNKKIRWYRIGSYISEAMDKSNSNVCSGFLSNKK